jgi:hypothetical protein
VATVGEASWNTHPLGAVFREVKEKSEGLAKAWGSRSYEISSSWLARLERGTDEMTVPPASPPTRSLTSRTAEPQPLYSPPRLHPVPR